jgi:hypothetical protein
LLVPGDQRWLFVLFLFFPFLIGLTFLKGVPAIELSKTETTKDTTSYTKPYPEHYQHDSSNRPRLGVAGQREVGSGFQSLGGLSSVSSTNKRRMEKMATNEKRRKKEGRKGEPPTSAAEEKEEGTGTKTRGMGTRGTGSREMGPGEPEVCSPSYQEKEEREPTPEQEDRSLLVAILEGTREGKKCEGKSCKGNSCEGTSEEEEEEFDDYYHP